jgi:hypothetical protein
MMERRWNRMRRWPSDCPPRNMRRRSALRTIRPLSNGWPGNGPNLRSLDQGHAGNRMALCLGRQGDPIGLEPVPVDGLGCHVKRFGIELADVGFPERKAEPFERPNGLSGGFGQCAMKLTLGHTFLLEIKK